MKPLSLDRLLQSQGLGTRAHCRAIIASGALAINGSAATDYRQKVNPESDQFTLFGAPFRYREFVYIALNKPEGYECSKNPTRHLGVMALLPEEFNWREVQPVGRLDQNTTGLLLLSDDGQFIHHLSSPKHHVPKMYRVTLQAPMDAALPQKLKAGVPVLDEPAPLAAIEAVIVDETHLDLTLAEGKYHQVRRMMAAAGTHCKALERIAIGALHLHALDLAPGEWRELTQDEYTTLIA